MSKTVFARCLSHKLMLHSNGAVNSHNQQLNCLAPA